MTTTYGRQFTWTDRRGNRTTYTVSGCSSQSEADRSLADMLAKVIEAGDYREPRWWEISRRGERIPTDIACSKRTNAGER